MNAIAELFYREKREEPMNSLRTILVPTDFSDCSRFAFRLAGKLARSQGAQLIVLHVHDSGILHIAEETGCDLIVIGTHGRSGWMRLLVGSVAEQILRQARCAVMAIRLPRPHDAIPIPAPGDAVVEQTG